MALSGVINGTTSNGVIVSKITWSAVQSIEGNYSDVTAILTYSRTNSGYTTDGMWSGSITINGVMYSASKYITITYNSNTEAIRTTVRVNHDGDGRKKITISASGGAPATSLKETYCSAEVELNSIPRFATISSAPAFNDTENPIIQYSNPAGNAVSSLVVGISLTSDGGDVVYRDDADKTGKTYQFKLTDKERDDLMKSTLNGSDTRKVFFFVQSTIGNTIRRYFIAKDFRVINANPILTTVLEDINEKTKSLTGGNSNYIKGYSDLQITLSAETQKHASVEGYTSTLGNDVQQGNVVVFKDIQSNRLITSVKDNRGLTDTHSEENNVINLIEYFKPTIRINGQIDMYGETNAIATIKINGEFFNNSFGVVDNSLDVYIKHTKSEDWISLTDAIEYAGNTYSLTYKIDDINYSEAISYQVKIVDRLADPYVTPESVLRLLPVFDWGENDFNFNVPISFNGIPMADYVVEQRAVDGWDYRKWNSGVAECWTNQRVITGTTPVELLGGYYSYATISLPIELETSSINAMANARLGTGVGLAFAQAGDSSHLTIYVIGNQNSNNIEYNAQVRGRWK